MDSSSKDIVSPREINEKCGAYPNDPEDVRKFGELLVNIITNKADYVLPFPITTLVIFFCYQIETDLQTDINKIYCLIGFITNSVSNFVKSRPDIKNSIEQMTEKELEDVIYPEIIKMLKSPMVESKSGGKRKAKKTQKRRRRGGMLPSMGRMGARIMRPIGATIRGTYRLAGKINEWLPEILTIIYFAYHIFYFFYYTRLIRVKTGSALTPNDPIFTEFVRNITLGVKSGEYPLLDPNITTGLVPVGDISREMQLYAPGETRVEEFIKNAKFISTFVLGNMLRRQYSFGNMLVTSVQSTETQIISIPGPNQMSINLFNAGMKGMMDDCFSDVPPKMIIDEANFLNELMTEHAPLLAPYSQQFTDSIKSAFPMETEVSSSKLIQDGPKLPGITSTDIDEEGYIDEEGDIYEDIHQEDIISPSEQLQPRENVGILGTITNFFGSVFDTALETETGKKASDVVTILDRQSVLYSNPEIRGQCMLESAENMRKTIELEAQLLAVQLRRLKTKFTTIWSMEKENAAKAIYHLCQAAGALTFYAGVKILTRRAAAPPAAAAAAAPDDDDDEDMGANALVTTGRGQPIPRTTITYATQTPNLTSLGTQTSPRVIDSNSNSNSASNSNSGSSLSEPLFLTQGLPAPVGPVEAEIRKRGNKSPGKGRWLNAADSEKGNSGGRTRRRATQTKKRRRPIRRRQTRKLRRNTKRRRM